MRRYHDVVLSTDYQQNTLLSLDEFETADETADEGVQIFEEMTDDQADDAAEEEIAVTEESADDAEDGSEEE